MTLHHFLGANIELPVGGFGRNPTYKSLKELESEGISLDGHMKNIIRSESIPVYETEEDAGGIDVFHLESWYEAVKDKFSTPFVYEVQGYLDTNRTSLHRKALKTLFQYMDEHLSEGDYMEIYSCWDGEEREAKDDRKDVVINLRTMHFGKHIKLKNIDELAQTFFLDDKQFVLIKK